FHQGMGAFTLTPQAGRTYYARITKPEGIAKKYFMPDPVSSGLTLAARASSRAEIDVNVGSIKDEEVSVVGQIRGKIVYTRHLTVHGGFTPIKVPTRGMPAGVLQVTLFDHQGIEQAERLVFVNKSDILNVQVSTDKERYLPREKVTMKIHATGEYGR